MSVFSVQNVPYLLLSALIVIISLWISKRIAHLVQVSWSMTAGHQATAKFLYRFTQISVLILGFGAALSASGVDASILIGGSTFAIGYALKNWLSNLLAGVMIASSKLIDVGWFVTTAEGGGSVLEIASMATKLKTIGNQTILIPNASLMTEPLGIFGQYPERLVKLEFWLTKDTDPAKAIAVMEGLITTLPEVSPVPEPPMVLLTDFSQGPQVYQIQYWVQKTKVKGSPIKYKNKLKLRIYDELLKAGMDMPFPVTTLNANNHDSGDFRAAEVLGLLRPGTAG